MKRQPRPWLSRLAFVLLALGLIAGTVQAQEPSSPAAAAPPASVPPESRGQQVDELLQILRDPAAREDLLQKLEALKAAEATSPPSADQAPPPADKAPPPGDQTPSTTDTSAPPADEGPVAKALGQGSVKVTPGSPLADADDAVGAVLNEISGRTAILRDIAQSIASTFDGVPDLAYWLESQVRDPVTREVWISVGSRVLLVLGLASFAHVVVGWALRGIRNRLITVEPGTMIERLPRLLAWLLVELIPVVAFVITAWIAYNALELRALALLVVQPLIEAVVIVRAAAMIAKVTFAPKAPAVRIPPMDDAMAQYAARWTRRIAATAIYGYFVLTAARRLGMPWELHGILVHVLFLAIAIMAIVVILQIRVPVERAIAGLAEEPHSAVMRRLPWRTLATIWHLLALVYVVSIYVVWALRLEGGFQALIEATVGSALIIALGWVAWRTIDQVFARQDDAPESSEAESRLPGFERRASRYRPVLAATSRATAIVGIVVGLLEVWGFGTLTWLLSDDGNNFIGHVLTVGAIILISAMVWEIFSMMVARSVAEKDEEGNPRLSSRARTLLNIIGNLVLVMLSVIALFLVLSELGLDVAPLLAGAGVIGLAIGFGSQKLVQDIITGLFMLVGDTIRVGDVAEIAGKAGVVEVVSMRTVALRDYGGNVHTIPYSAIDVVTNFTKEYSYALFDIPVAYRENVDEVMDLLRAIGEEMNRDPVFRRLILEPLDVAGVDKFGDSAVIIRARFKTRALRQWEVLREFNRRVKNRFDELGVEIPLPHRTVYFGVDKQGRAPAARVDLGSRDQPQDVSQRELELAPPPTSLVARSSG